MESEVVIEGSYGFNSRELSRILGVLLENRALLLEDLE
jgi:hypothetical protein